MTRIPFRRLPLVLDDALPTEGASARAVAKRAVMLAVIRKKNMHYRIIVMAEGEIPVEPVNDTTVSKRQWEARCQEWRHALRAAAENIIDYA